VAKQYRNQEFIDQITKKISEVRTAKGIVQEDIVDRTGFTQKQVWKILNGKINPTISTIEAVAKAMEVHPRDLLDFDFDIPKYSPLRKDRKK
jgi:transcriptional regulator with XRE-family HTH domain